MKLHVLSALVLASSAYVVSGAEFDRPVRLMSGDKAIRVERPGLAAPCWADLRGNGQKQLLVGQFHEGKIRVFEHLRGENFGPGKWLQADGQVAEVPGVW